MEYSMLIILLALLQYMYFGFLVGKGRTTYGIVPSKTTGHETWERLYRVHMNSLESLIVFIPALLMFSFYVSPLWALVPGIAYLIVRAMYARLYVKNPVKRGPPLGFLVNAILILGSAIGIILSLVHTA